MRCYGPTLPKDAPWPPTGPTLLGFPKLLMSDGAVIDETTNLPYVDPDPVGMNLAANEMFAVFYRYSVNSYQDGTPAGLAAHNRFITDFAASWTNMVTAGYSNSYNNKYGKLGTLTAFDFSTQCPNQLIRGQTSFSYIEWSDFTVYIPYMRYMFLKLAVTRQLTETFKQPFEALD